MRGLLYCCLPIALLSACGDDAILCGEGTTEESGICQLTDPAALAPTTTASPPGGAFIELPPSVTLVADRAATIYYTTDGTEPTTESESGASPVTVEGITTGQELRFFAVTEDGAREAEIRSAIYIEGITPDPLRGFNASGTDDVTVAWTQPDDASRAVVVKSDRAPIAFTPQPGVTYAVGDEVATGVTVVYAGDAEEFTDDDVAAGSTAVYAGFALSDILLYSTATSAAIAAPGPTATATISVALDGTVTVTSPTGFSATGTANYDADADFLNVDLEITSDAGRNINAPKLFVDNLNQGDLDNEDTTPDTEEDFIRMGSASLAPSTPRTVNIQVQSVDGSQDPITFDVELRGSRIALLGQAYNTGFGASIVDLGTGTDIDGVDCDQYHGGYFDNGYCSWRRTVFSTDGRLLYGGAKAAPAIRVVDPSTMTAVMAIVFGSYGHVNGLLMHPDGRHLYATFGENGHGYPSDDGSEGHAGDLFLVKVDTATHSEVGRVRIASAADVDTDERLRSLAFTADGRSALITMFGLGQLAVVNLATMTVARTVELTDSHPNQVAVAPDGSTATLSYSGSSNDSNMVDIVDLSSFVVDNLIPPSRAEDTACQGHAVFYPSATEVWVGWYECDDTVEQGISVIDLSGDTPTVTDREVDSDIGNDEDLHAMLRDGSRVLISTDNGLSAIDATSKNVVPLVTNQEALTTTETPGSHWIAVSPF